MEPYLIICNSCTARLKVTQEAMIGQRLACPKCQSMVDVTAPQGYRPPVDGSEQDDDSPPQTDLAESFEDIDSLLANVDNTPPKPKQVRPAASVSDASQINSAPEPTIPESQWHSDATRRNKRLLKRIAMGVVGLVAFALVVWVFLGGGIGGGGRDGAGSLPVATEQSNPKEEAVDDSLLANKVATGVEVAAGENKTDGQPNQPVQSNQDSATAASVTPTPSQSLDRDPPVASAPDVTPLGPDATEDPLASPTRPSLADERPKTPRAANAAVVPLLPGESTGAAGQSADSTTNTSSDSSASVDQKPGDLTSPFIASTENSLGELSKILQGQGTSLRQIQDIAEIQKERSLIGTPKYYVQRVSKSAADVQRQLSAELSGWKLDGVPLIDAVSDIELLADVPITFSQDVFTQARFNLNRPVTLKVESVSFKDALELVLADDGLAIEILPDGVSIVLPPIGEIETKSYPQSFCTDENSANRLRELIVAVTGVNDWEDHERYALAVSTDAVTVSHRDRQHKQIAALLEKLQAAASYADVLEAASIKETLRPLALSAEGTLALSPDLKSANPYRRSLRLGGLFRKVRAATDLNVVADWKHLVQLGWFPSTQLPGGIDEPTNAKLLDQLGHALELTTIVVGPNTVMLTSFENAGRRRDVEVFSVGDVIDNKMSPVQLDQLLTQTMGVDQLSPPNAVVIYFAECKCLVANAPQIIQRQLFSIVNEL